MRAHRRTGFVTTAAAIVAVGIVWPIQASAGLALADRRNCLSCHHVGDKLVGPAYKDVAAKYAGQPDASARLVEKVMRGGGGVWGAVPMPANPRVSEAEARQLVQWILSLQ